MQLDQSILVCGGLCSGKTSVIRSITSVHPIQVVSFGAMVKSKAAERNLPTTRKSLQDLGYEIFTSRGTKPLIEMAIEHAGQKGANSLIFDGVRHELVLNEIKTGSKKILVIYLRADENTRFERYKNHHGPGDLSFQDFQKIDRHPIEMGSDSLEQYANMIIDAKYSLDCVCKLANEITNYFLSEP